MNRDRTSGASGSGGTPMVGGRIPKTAPLVAHGRVRHILDGTFVCPDGMGKLVCPSWSFVRKARVMHLQTPRLLLRDFILDDFPAVHAYASLPQTVRFMEWGPNTEDQTKEFLHRKLAAQQASPRVEYELGIVLQQTRQVIGGIGLRLNRPDHRAADMGYVLHPDHWNHGYATEAARALLDFGFNQHHLHRIMAT